MAGLGRSEGDIDGAAGADLQHGIAALGLEDLEVLRVGALHGDGGDPSRHQADIRNREGVRLADQADLQRVEVVVAALVCVQRRQTSRANDLRLHVERIEPGLGDLDRPVERPFRARCEDHGDPARPTRWDGIALDAITERDAELGIR